MAEHEVEKTQGIEDYLGYSVYEKGEVQEKLVLGGKYQTDSDRESSANDNEGKENDEHPALAGKYYILNKIGEGGQGKVFKALDTKGKLVAIKTFDFNQFDTWKAEELIHREAEILESLHMKGVPEFIEYIEDHPNYYIIESYIDAPSLETKIKKGLWIDYEEIIKVLKGVSMILYGLQKRTHPVFHRDIKPANILMMGDDVYLVDFGSVAALKQKTNSSTVTGTSGYSAPEQYYGKVNASADIFGLGTTILHLVTGVAPWEAGMRGLTLDYASHIPNGFSKQLGRLLLDMINPNPDDRIQDAEALLKRIEQIEKGENRSFSVKRNEKENDNPVRHETEQHRNEVMENNRSEETGNRFEETGSRSEETVNRFDIRDSALSKRESMKGQPSSKPLEKQSIVPFLISCLVFILCLFFVLRRPRLVIYLSFPIISSALAGTWFFFKYIKSFNSPKVPKPKRNVKSIKDDPKVDIVKKDNSYVSNAMTNGQRNEDGSFSQNDMILSLDCPAIRGFRHEREVIEEATLYYMNYGADAMKYARNHFFMFDPIHSSEDRHYEYLFLEKLLSLGVKTSVNYHDLERLSVLEKMERPEYESKTSPLLSYFTDPGTLELLISYGVDVNERSENGETPLSIFAGRWGKLEKSKEIFDLLISHGADVKGNSNIITNINQIDGFDYLISKGAIFDPNYVKQNRKMNSLINHVRNNDLDIVKRYIELGVDVNLMDEKNVPVIIYSGSRQMFDLLHDAGAVINKSIVKKAVEKGENPLFHAVKNDDISLVRLWLTLGADVNGVSEKNDPYPIFFGKSVEMLELLSSSGANIRKQCGGFYHTGLYYASSAAAAQWMIDAGLDVRTKDDYQNTPLHRVQSADIVPVLVTHGAEVNARNIHGDTPLYRAVRSAEMADLMQYDERVKVVDWLLKAGADGSIMDKSGHKPLYHAGSIQLIRMLLEK